MKSKLLVLALAPAMLIAVPLQADETRTDAPLAKGKGAHHDEMVSRFDKDGDGKLNDAERAAAREAVKQHGGPLHDAFMKRYDADGDGKLSDSERATGQADWKAFMAKHDKNGDGELSPEERKAARDAWAAEHPEAAAQLRSAVDTDGDGTVSRKEKRAAAKEMRKKRAGKDSEAGN